MSIRSCLRSLSGFWLAAAVCLLGLPSEAAAAPASRAAKRPPTAAPAPAKGSRSRPQPRRKSPAATVPAAPSRAQGRPPSTEPSAPDRRSGVEAQISPDTAPARAAVVDSAVEGGVQTYTFGAQEVEGRLRSPQILYFLRRVRAEFDPAPLGHRSFLLELSDTRRHRSLQ